jgi:hypothetical protein
MTEGKGYCARLQERKTERYIAKLIKNKKKIIVIPESSK